MLLLIGIRNASKAVLGSGTYGVTGRNDGFLRKEPPKSRKEVRTEKMARISFFARSEARRRHRQRDSGLPAKTAVSAFVSACRRQSVPVDASQAARGPSKNRGIFRSKRRFA
jgi:hypothetical protein